MSSSPLISVILPTYNRATTLDRAIRSVLNQSFGDFEIVIVDDGSTDESRSTLKKYTGMANVRAISSGHHGCSAARNLGVSVSKAPLVAFQDSDDEWLPHKLERAVAVLTSPTSDTGIFYSDMMRVHRDGRCSEWRSPDIHRGVLVSERTLDYQTFGIGIQAAVIKRECFAQVGLFDEALPRFIDLDLFVRLSDRFDFHHHSEPLVKYYASNDGISTDTHALVLARRYLIRKYRKRLRVERRHLAHQYLLLADALRMNGNRGHSQALAALAMLACPGNSQVRRRVREILRAAAR